MLLDKKLTEHQLKEPHLTSMFPPERNALHGTQELSALMHMQEAYMEYLHRGFISRFVELNNVQLMDKAKGEWSAIRHPDTSAVIYLDTEGIKEIYYQDELVGTTEQDWDALYKKLYYANPYAVDRDKDELELD